MSYRATLSRPVAAAALAIPDLAAVILSAYCSGMRVDFQPPACVSTSAYCDRTTFLAPFLQADEFVELPLQLPERRTLNADGMDAI
jgi:hypothetical protein